MRYILTFYIKNTVGIQLQTRCHNNYKKISISNDDNGVLQISDGGGEINVGLATPTTSTPSSSGTASTSTETQKTMVHWDIYKRQALLKFL